MVAKTKEEQPQLYMPTSWWAQIIPALDQKIQMMATNYGFGNICLEVIIAKGKVRDLVFRDEVRLRQDFTDAKEKTNLTQPKKE